MKRKRETPTHDRWNLVAAGTATASTEAVEGWYNERIFLAMCAVLIIAGSFGPWITAERTDAVHYARSGMDFDGLWTLVGGAVIAVLVFLRMYIGVIVVGALVTLCGVLNERDFQDGALFDDGRVFLSANIGLGLFAVLAGGVGAVILGMLCIRPSAASGTSGEGSAHRW